MVLVRINLLLLASIASLVFITGPPFNALADETTQDDVHNDDDVCESRICHETATKILNDMDNSIDPCDDFYSFACGSFVKNAHIPDNKIIVNVFNSLSHEIEQKLKYTLEGPSPANEPKYIRAVKNFYKSCMKAGVESRNNKSEENSSLSAKCVLVLLSHIPTQILYAREYFRSDAIPETTKLFNDLKNVFTDLIISADWMDVNTRTGIMRKIEALTGYIGCPDAYWNDTMMDKALVNFVFDENNYPENIKHQKIYKPKIYDALKALLPTGSAWRHKLHVATTSPTAYTYENKIVIPAGAFQGSFYNNSRPRFMNYATIVPIIAHEITHICTHGSGFYDFDKFEKFLGFPQTHEPILDQKVQCFVEQYSNFTIEEIGMKINGSYTEIENIADNVGFKIAYMAYDAWSKAHGKEQRLPGLDYSPKQMFWISAANMWCTKYRPEKVKNRLIKNPHSPPKFRILGSFQNNPEFAADFGCKLGSRMNPVKKCDLW